MPHVLYDTMSYWWLTSHKGMLCGVLWCRVSFIVYITTGNLLKETCSKKPLKICGCLLVLTITVCIVVVVATTITTITILHRNSSPFSVTTTFNSTVVVPLKKFVKSFSITSTRDAVDYSCTLATVTLPCSALNKSYLRNQSVDDISNDLESNFLYLLTGSIMHFRFDNNSNCPSYTLWVFRDKLNNLESTILCTTLNEHKFKGKCITFMGSGTLNLIIQFHQMRTTFIPDMAVNLEGQNYFWQLTIIGTISLSMSTILVYKQYTFHQGNAGR